MTAGQAGIDSGAELAANATLALVDASGQPGVALAAAARSTKSPAGAAEPLEPPDAAAPWAYLGAATMAAGALTALDRSGVLTVGRGGLLVPANGGHGGARRHAAGRCAAADADGGRPLPLDRRGVLQLGAVAAAVADTAGAPSAGYVQAEAAAVLAELRALKASLEAAGILTP